MPTDDARERERDVQFVSGLVDHRGTSSEREAWYRILALLGAALSKEPVARQGIRRACGFCAGEGCGFCAGSGRRPQAEAATSSAPDPSVCEECWGTGIYYVDDEAELCVCIKIELAGAAPAERDPAEYWDEQWRCHRCSECHQTIKGSHACPGGDECPARRIALAAAPGETREMRTVDDPLTRACALLLERCGREGIFAAQELSNYARAAGYVGSAAPTGEAAELVAGELEGIAPRLGRTERTTCLTAARLLRGERASEDGGA